MIFSYLQLKRNILQQHPVVLKFYGWRKICNMYKCSMISQSPLFVTTQVKSTCQRIHSFTLRWSISPSSIISSESMLQPILWSLSMFPQKNKLLIFLQIHSIKKNLSIYGKYWELFLFPPLTKSSLKRKKSSYCIFNISRWSFQVHMIHMIENDYW